MTRFITCVCLLFLTQFADAQIANSFRTTIPPASGTALRTLIESLIGEGMVLKNYSITRKVSDDAFGLFEDDEARLGMKKGLLMTSGGVSGLTGANTQPGFSRNHGSSGRKQGTYAELGRLLTGSPPTFDACVIELDIVPTADTLSFNYVFGSEEYDEYVGSQFNDVFGFFISGKGIEGERNLAVVPGTDIPVSINSINGGTENGMNSRYSGTLNDATGSNPTFYVRNTAGQVALEYDGLTRLMEIRQPVIPYETYHLKIAIADVSDDALDSGVFIEGKSFMSYDKSYNVLFDPNSSSIEEGYDKMLRDIASVYAHKHSADRGKIIITGHTDSDGPPALNEALSERRAREVQNHLQSLGIPGSEMILVAKGENMPRADNFQDEGKMVNRRVEIRLCGSRGKYADLKAQEFFGSGNEVSAIADNFPNPFSGRTVVRAFIKPDAVEARLVVMDAKGSLVRVIHILERGQCEITLDADDLPSGAYYAALNTDNVPAGRLKMLLQK